LIDLKRRGEAGRTPATAGGHHGFAAGENIGGGVRRRVS
jgi:hypothetical protein